MISSCMWLPFANCCDDQVFLVGPRSLLIEVSSLHVSYTIRPVVPESSGLQEKAEAAHPHHKRRAMSIALSLELTLSRHTQCLYCMAPRSLG